MGESDAPNVRRVQGRRIRQARNRADLTLTELSQRLAAEHGIVLTPQAISAWERGETSPRLHLRVPLCQIIGVDPADIFGSEL
jgi:transcriptional regulator with XRE-family HTH domain